MIASLFSANGVAAVTDSCQGYDVKASCQASRQSLSGITQDWSIADGQWLVFSDMTNNASGGAVFLQQGAGNDSNLLIVFYVQIMPDDFVMQLHRF